MEEMSNEIGGGTGAGAEEGAGESKIWFYIKIILVIVFIFLGMKYFYDKRKGFQTKPSFIKGVTPDIKDKKSKKKSTYEEEIEED